MQPGEAPAVFGDALRYLAQAATYLYQDNARYWYSTQPTVTKLADDRAELLKREPEKVAEVLVGEKLPNPTGHRLSRSQTLAKYNQPSSVWM